MHFSRSTSPMPFRLIGAFTGVSLSLLLASCGGGDKTSDTPASDSASTTTTTTATTSGASSNSTGASTSGAASDSTKTAASGDTTTTTTSTSSSSGGSSDIPAGWKPYTSTDGNFTAAFPGTPGPESGFSTDSTSKAGEKEEMTTVSVLSGTGIYEVSWTSLEHVMDKNEAATMMNKAVNSVSGKNKVVNDLTFQGHPAKQVTVEKPLQRGTLFTDDMIFVVRNRLYQVEAVVDKGPESAAKIKKFRDTFKLNVQ